MDQFIKNLVGNHKAGLRSKSMHLVGRGYTNVAKIEGEWWDDFLSSAESEDLTNDIIAHYTNEFRQEARKAVKEFVDQYAAH